MNRLKAILFFSIAFFFYKAGFSQTIKLDSIFGINGKVITADFIPWGQETVAKSLAIQPDGKIVVGGTSDPNGYNHIALARYNSDGSLDPSFGSFGMVYSSLGGYEELNTLKLQSDGKIIVVGTTFNITDEYSYSVIIRYNADGSIDHSFGNNGMNLLMDCDYESALTDLIILPDGKILCVGYASCFANGGYNFFLIKYNSDGQIDSSFGINGKVITSVLYCDFSNTLLVQPDGKIVIDGTSFAYNQNFGCSVGGNARYCLVRFNENGSIDSSFAHAGMHVFPAFESARCMTLQPDGKIIVGGGEFDLDLIRVNSDGTLDNSFGEYGIHLDYYTVNSIQLLSNGNFLVFGKQDSGLNISGSDFMIGYISSQGNLISFFNSKGCFLDDFNGNDDEITSSVLLSDSSMVVCGFAKDWNNLGPMRFALAKYIIDTTKTLPNLTYDYDLKIYPSPTNGNFIVSIISKYANNINLSIVNVLGQEVKNERLGLNKGENLFQFNLNNLIAGIYILELEDNDSIVVDKFIIQ